MSERLNRRKLILFLGALSLFAYFVSKKMQIIDVAKVEIESNEYDVTEKVKVTVDENQLVQDTSYEIDENLDPVKQVYTNEVLGTTSSSGTCRTTDDLVYTSKKVCSTSVELEENFEKRSEQPAQGDMISRDAKIRLVSVVVPPLLSGSPTMDSSVKQIYKEEEGDYHWTLKPAGEMISEKVVASNEYYPGDTKTEGLLEEMNDTQIQLFGITYSVKGGENAEGGGKTDFTVSNYYTNNCIKNCDNSPNPTPEKYLEASEILAKSKNYPSYYEEQVSEETDDSIGDCGDENSTFLRMKSQGAVSIGCTPPFKEVVANFFKKITSIFDAQSCTADSEEDENCVSTASIIIIMESPWGTKVDCKDNGQCVNEFNDLRSGDYKYAGETDKKNIYLLTDCDADIEGVGIKTLQCAWDIDYIAKEVEFQANDNIPGEEYPDTMDYLEFHVEESENRSVEPIPM